MNLRRYPWLINTFAISTCLLASIVQAQVIPDKTTATKVIGDCLTRCNVEGGIRANSNLFHSFQEFNLNSGASLYFLDPGVANIFTRVTGNHPSEIFGTLGVTGNANLWLINPQGILFGNGASLDLNGSFVATTADQIQFGDRGFFSANPHNQENLPLLTVNPSAFFYQQMGHNNPIKVEGASLSVPAQENLILLGAQNNQSSSGVSLQGVNLKASQGNIQIGAVANNSQIEISPNFQLEFPNNITQGNITLNQGSFIDLSGIGGGNLHLQGANITIADSLILAMTTGNLDGGTIDISADNFTLTQATIFAPTISRGTSNNIQIAAETINITGNGSDQYQTLIEQSLTGTVSVNTAFAGILTASQTEGKAGNIKITSNNLALLNGAIFGSIVYGSGKGGDVTVNSLNDFHLSASALLSFSAIDSKGNTGKIEIDTNNLTLENAAMISTATLGKGNSGDININATDRVQLQKTPQISIFPTTIFTNSFFKDSGSAGNITITTSQLSVEDGSQISSASGLLTSESFIPFGGAGGNINIQASESLTITGSSPDGIFPSSIISDTRSSNPAGNIAIETGKLLMEKTGTISASSIGTGNGGNLQINATESIELNGADTNRLLNLIENGISGRNIDLNEIRGGLSTTTIDGNAGNIQLTTPNLSLNQGFLISSGSFGKGNGGDINIQTSQTLEIVDSIVGTASLQAGDSGKITINTNNLLIKNNGLLATATLGLGKAGAIEINAQELIELSSQQNSSLLIPGGIVTSNLGGSLKAPGNVQIKTKNLIIQDGMHIDFTNQFSAFATNQNETVTLKPLIPGNSIIQATEAINISGTSADGVFASGINSTTQTPFPASNIKIITPQLKVTEGANISVSSLGTGTAGSLEIIADNVDLENGGILNGETLSGKGGNIQLQLADNLQISDRSKISTNAFNQGDGGNIRIDADFLIAFPPGSITANAIAGKGGNISILAQDIFLASPNQISASSQLGIDGQVKISTFPNSLRHNLAELPQQILEKEQKMVSRCGTGDGFGEGSFVYVGKGALSPNLLEGYFAEDNLLVDWGDDFTVFETYSSGVNQTTQQPIIEANELKYSDRRELMLTVNYSTPTLQPYHQTCPFSSQTSQLPSP